MVFHADTVVGPGTVMVPTLDTPIANAAVVGAGRRQHLAARADVIRVEIFEQVPNLVLFLEVAWVSAPSPQVAYRDGEDEDKVDTGDGVRDCVWRRSRHDHGQVSE